MVGCIGTDADNGYLDKRKGKRVSIGLAPVVYDRYDVTYPKVCTKRMVYSRRQESGVLLVVGILEFVYTDETRTILLSAERVSIA